MKFYSIIIIDNNVEKTDRLKYNSLLLIIFQKNFSNSTIVFFEYITQSNILKYCKYGISNLFSISNIDVFLIPSIKKILHLIPEPDKIVIKDRGISLYLHSSYVIYKGCKISLAKIEILILQYLLNRNTLCSKNELILYLYNRINKKITTKYLIVSISRLRKKIFKHTGINLIKNRNGFGYYITI